MKKTLHELKLTLQEHFSDGLVIIVGSGLSAAVGLPSMQVLADHLIESIPREVTHELNGEWLKIAQMLQAGIGLEKAIDLYPPSRDLESAIIKLTADVVVEGESKAIAQIINEGGTLAFSKLLRRLVIPNSGLSVITTNYDRLLEFAIEAEGYGVDQMFIGQSYGKLDAKQSKQSFVTKLKQGKGSPIMQYRNRVNLYKPHGSLDWYWHNNQPVRCSLNIDCPRLLITPGSSKYVKGYSAPFDIHREKANHAIDEASRFLIIGYGFNDQHLETHLMPQLERGKPCLILARSFTQNAKRVVDNMQNVISLTMHEQDDDHGTMFCKAGIETYFPSIGYWDLDNFVEGIFS